ncbi:hypothetical protein [Halalkalibacter krulwichiae]|uniref:Uncharacterized protein n=1 Tax=Halalkalibacter krulwichiae TaxID=199441 RepID=A0A1X9MAC6_9BACI|nr:hypothetical protein [Halalkalibacter krulwichiae]ARK30375.1 hypothetical protein BkAM31D_11350 [Halalkalibacter krulwichiae]
MEWFDKMMTWFTPAHKKTVDEHLLREKTTRNLIEDTEALLERMAANAPSYNKKHSMRRKQKDWLIKVKVNHNLISVIMMDLKHSPSPIKKRFVIICYRKYMKSKDGVGVCKEASIRYIKDGRAQVRSIQQSPLFHAIFFRIHQLDLAYSNELVSIGQPSTEVLANQETLLQASPTNDLTILLEESHRYIHTVKQFSLDPVIESRLSRVLKQAEKLKDDFLLLDFEERHTVRRMFKNDIPTLLHTFLSLSVKNQLEHKENLYVTLSKMELTLIGYVERLEKLKVERMDHLLKLQSLRYDNK